MKEEGRVAALLFHASFAHPGTRGSLSKHRDLRNGRHLFPSHLSYHLVGCQPHRLSALPPGSLMLTR